MLDPDKGGQIFVGGKKGSGKSVMARNLFDSFPYDRLVIDVTGDVSADLRRDGVKFTKLTPDALPLRFPSRGPDGEPVTAVLVPDMGDEREAMAQMDRALGLALDNRKTLAWVDEVGAATRNGITLPNLRRALHHGRHKQITLLLCGPRPKDIDPLCVSQADHVFIFRMPNPADRKRIAENIGWPPDRLDAAVHELQLHEYLWFNGPEDTLSHMPPLPHRHTVELTA